MCSSSASIAGKATVSRSSKPRSRTPTCGARPSRSTRRTLTSCIGDSDSWGGPTWSAPWCDPETSCPKGREGRHLELPTLVDLQPGAVAFNHDAGTERTREARQPLENVARLRSTGRLRETPRIEEL